MLYAREVHRLLRRRFLVFLQERGYVSCTRWTTGAMARKFGDVGKIRFGYQLGFGCHPGIGGDLQLFADVLRNDDRCIERFGSTGDLLLGPQRERYRAAAASLLTRILTQDDLSETDESVLETFRDKLTAELERTHSDPDYLPPYRYQTEDDLLRWCRLVVPAIPELTERLERVLWTSRSRER